MVEDSTILEAIIVPPFWHVRCEALLGIIGQEHAGVIAWSLLDHDAC